MGALSDGVWIPGNKYAWDDKKVVLVSSDTEYAWPYVNYSAGNGAWWGCEKDMVLNSYKPMQFSVDMSTGVLTASVISDIDTIGPCVTFGRVQGVTSRTVGDEELCSTKIGYS